MNTLDLTNYAGAKTIGKMGRTALNLKDIKKSVGRFALTTILCGELVGVVIALTGAFSLPRENEYHSRLMSDYALVQTGNVENASRAHDDCLEIQTEVEKMRQSGEFLPSLIFPSSLPEISSSASRLAERIEKRYPRDPVIAMYKENFEKGRY